MNTSHLRGPSYFIYVFAQGLVQVQHCSKLDQSAESLIYYALRAAMFFSAQKLGLLQLNQVIHHRFIHLYMTAFSVLCL